MRIVLENNKADKLVIEYNYRCRKYLIKADGTKHRVGDFEEEFETAEEAHKWFETTRVKAELKGWE